MDPVPQEISHQNPTLPQQQIQEQNPLPKRSRLPLVLIILSLFIIVAMIGLIFYKHSKTQIQQNMAPNPTTITQKYNSSNSHVPVIPSVLPTQGVFITSYPPNTWKTYSSSSFHYSIKYPSDWKNQNLGDSGSILLTSPDYDQYNPKSTGVSIIITAVATTSKTADQEWQQEEKNEELRQGGKTSPDVTIPYKDIIINGISALQYDIGPEQKAPPAKSTMLVTGGYAYHFSTATYPDQKTENLVLNIYNQVLSSFTFIK